jgi:DNA topoisomerase I
MPVTSFLFGKLVDYEFTASMEEDLDKIANGEEERTKWLTTFFYGHDDVPGLEFLAQDLGISMPNRSTP